MNKDPEISTEYREWIKSIKIKIQSARNKVALSVNSHVLELYWDLGKTMSDKINSANWGSKIIEQISIDLKHEFPEINGFSRRNLYAIKQWHEFYAQQFDFVPQVVAQLPWGHNRLIIGKTKDIETAIFYSSLLCRKKGKIEAEYALRDINKPMGISEYRLTEAIPDDLKIQLPTIEELEHDLNEKIKDQINN